MSIDTQLLARRAADTFLLHGGLEYITTDELLSFFGATNHEFRKHARREFNFRLKQCHPALAAACDNISWRQWKRFEMDESESRESGESWEVYGSDDLMDIDVLLEVTNNDNGAIVWHGCTPLERGPEATFNVPHMFFDAPKPDADDMLEFESPSPHFPGLTDYHYWIGRRDCSLQQKTLCKSLYRIAETEPLLHVHVVLRRRSNGKMVTLLSNTKPNQILGEDYGNNVGEYSGCYHNQHELFEDDDRVASELSFELNCPNEVEEMEESIRFTTLDHPSESAFASIFFHFIIFDQDNDEGESLILDAMDSWKWG
jgi:hypothetical protein